VLSEVLTASSIAVVPNDPPACSFAMRLRLLPIRVWDRTVVGSEASGNESSTDSRLGVQVAPVPQHRVQDSQGIPADVFGYRQAAGYHQRGAPQPLGATRVGCSESGEGDHIAPLQRVPHTHQRSVFIGCDSLEGEPAGLGGVKQALGGGHLWAIVHDAVPGGAQAADAQRSSRGSREGQAHSGYPMPAQRMRVAFVSGGGDTGRCQ
jgi:hypothetical protein